MPHRAYVPFRNVMIEGLTYAAKADPDFAARMRGWVEQQLEQLPEVSETGLQRVSVNPRPSVNREAEERRRALLNLRLILAEM